jgi:hypothetical protein
VVPVDDHLDIGVLTDVGVSKRPYAELISVREAVEIPERKPPVPDPRPGAGGDPASDELILVGKSRVDKVLPTQETIKYGKKTIGATGAAKRQAQRKSGSNTHRRTHG